MLCLPWTVGLGILIEQQLHTAYIGLKRPFIFPTVCIYVFLSILTKSIDFFLYSINRLSFLTQSQYIWYGTRTKLPIT
jgi:hypothetical protein